MAAVCGLNLQNGDIKHNLIHLIRAKQFITASRVIKPFRDFSPACT